MSKWFSNIIALEKIILLAFCFIAASQLLHSQTIIPQENGVPITPLDPNLSFPDNFDHALVLMKEAKIANHRSLTHYHGQQALRIAIENGDENRIIEALQNISRFYLDYGQYASADSLYTHGLGWVTQPLNKATLYLNKVGLSARTRNWEDTEELLTKARQLIGNDTLDAVMANYHFRAGIYELEAQNNIVQALIHYQKAKKIKAIGKRLTLVINNNISIIYAVVNDFEKARTISLENLHIAQEQKDINGRLFAYYGLAFNSGKMGDEEGLLKYSQQAIHLHNTTGVSTAFGYIYSLLGEHFIQKNQLDSAEYYLIKGIELSKEQGENKELVDCYQAMMNLHALKNETDIAIEYGELGLSLSIRVHHDIETPLSILYKKKGNYKRAYDLLQNRSSKQEEQEKKENNILLMASLLEERFEQERTQQDLEYQQTLARQRNILLNGTLASVILLALLIVFLQARSRKKLKKLNNSLMGSNDALKQFAYITSHDLKEPVRNITSFSNLLKRRLSQRDNTEDEKEFLGFITNNALVLKEIVDSLQVFTKISFGELEHETVPLDEVFQTVKNNLQQSLQEVNGQLTIHNPARIKDIFFARHMLILVLQNLIQNGIKYNDATPPEVDVEIVPQPNGTVLFRVKDNGIGIEEEYFERIFIPFKTLKNKSVTQSSGLGLSICKTILERYGSNIHVASDGKNGSTFSFSI